MSIVVVPISALLLISLPDSGAYTYAIPLSIPVTIILSLFPNTTTFDLSASLMSVAGLYTFNVKSISAPPLSRMLFPSSKRPQGSVLSQSN